MIAQSWTDVDAAAWRGFADSAVAQRRRLLALWASRQSGSDCVRAAYVGPRGLDVASLAVPDPSAAYPGIEDVFPAASRMQRAIADLNGLRSTDPDTRPWLRHASWPARFRPLVDATAPVPSGDPTPDDYRFVPVSGDGVHEIAVGPVHAGIIEPGHFRFSVVGEKVLRLEQHLGYVHKGIERRLTDFPLLDGHRLAGRASGDSTVAYAWAYCQAVENMAGTGAPPRAAWLRMLALELERLANHCGDIGAIGNDAGFAFGLAQFSRIKEQLLRATALALGRRYLQDYVVPGGTARDLADAGRGALRACLGPMAHELQVLRDIYEEHAGLRDRFAGAGAVSAGLAARLGLTGLAGRASGQAQDLRCDHPWQPYDALRVNAAARSDGDVAARVAVRFDEAFESLRLLLRALEDLPAGPHHAAVAEVGDGARSIGIIEGWRGPVLVALEAGAGGSIRRCHLHDPSWQNWPALEHAVIDNIVPDFPLINKSFNLSYSGHDL